MSLYDDFLEFEAKYFRLKDPSYLVPNGRVDMRVYDELRRLNRYKTKLSSKKYCMDNTVFIEAVVCFYKLLCICKEYNMNTPKIHYPPLVQDHIKVLEVMDS